MLINNQIETLLKSNLYGTVIVISFRGLEELTFEAQDLQEKYVNV